MNKQTAKGGHYRVVYEQGPRNWSAYVPRLPGCIATGATRKEVAQRIHEAIAFHLEGLERRAATPEHSNGHQAKTAARRAQSASL